MEIRRKNTTVLIVSSDQSMADTFWGMLKDIYTVKIMDNGRSAIACLLENAGETGLVLLDENINDISCETFFIELQKIGLIKKVPVMVVFESFKEESVKKVIGLGAIDYMVCKSCNEGVVNRISNVINHFSKNVCNYEDAIVMLLDIFHNIIKVNLDSNLCMVALNDGEHGRKQWEDVNYTEEIRSFVDKGNVYSDDIDTYLEFTDVDNIKEKIKNSKNHLSCKYRRRNGEVYRWVQMELVKSSEYTEDNKVVVFYVRDIHDEYMKQLSEADRISRNAVACVYFNLTSDEILSTSGQGYRGELNECNLFSEFVGRASLRIPNKKEKEEYLSLFSKESLMKKINSGEMHIEYNHAIIIDEENQYSLMLKTVVELTREKMTGDILGTFYSNDVTDEYVDDKLPALLYEYEYESVGLINTKNELLELRTPFSALKHTLSGLRERLDYKTSSRTIAKAFVPKEEEKAFLKNIALKTIVSNLKKKDVYEFTVHHIEENGEKRLKKYKYMYFHKEMEIILAAVEDITDISEYDVITGGYNRQGFVRRCEQIISANSKDDEYRMLYFDIKGFKAINEIFGVQSGDEVIRYVHDMIKKSEIKPLAVARTTTDHFVCLIRREDLNFDALLGLCQLAYTKNGKVMTVYLRCGIYNVDDTSLDINQMYDRAKLAISNIKNEYVTPFVFYEKSLNVAYIDKNEVLGELQRAIKNNEFEAYYQPIFDAKTRKIASAEALVRWKHPERGMVSPGVFIPVLEEHGHISQVDLFIEKSVKKFNEERLQQGKLTVPVSVNLSRMDFFDVEMISTIYNDVENAEELKGLYRFEVTESSYVSVAANNLETLSKMRDLGAKILVDDFGSGYSSFNTITEYDFDIIKLDMGFVKKIGTNKKIEGVTSSLIDMAHYLDAKVVAEGAETEEQVKFLTENDCDYIQGFYFSKPLPREEFEKLLDEQGENS